MALIPGFEHDIFLSYAWGDDVRALNPDGWIFEFRNALQQALRESLSREQKMTGSKVDIFLDNEQLRRDDPLRGELKRRVQSSACLLVMMSPNYLKSDYCRQELEFFIERWRAGGTVHSLDRSLHPIIIAHLRPTDRNTLPEYLRETVGNRFYKESDDDDPRLCWPRIAGSRDLEEFAAILNKMKTGLVAKFKRAVELSEPNDLEPPGGWGSGDGTPGAIKRPLVLLASSPDLASKLGEVQKTLGEKDVDGVVVDVDKNSPSVIEQWVTGARAVVMLLGMPGSEHAAMMKKQLLEFSANRGLPRFVGMDPLVRPLVEGLPQEYDSYKTLVEESGPDSKWMDVVALGSGVLTGIVQGTPSGGSGASVEVTIYIDNAPEDRPAAETVVSFLHKTVHPQLLRRNIELSTWLPDERDYADPKFNEKRRERVGSSNGAVVVVSSKVPEGTAASKIKDILKNTARNRRYRIAVHDGPPPLHFSKHFNPRVCVIEPDDPSYLDSIVAFVTGTVNTHEE